MRQKLIQNPVDKGFGVEEAFANASARQISLCGIRWENTPGVSSSHVISISSWRTNWPMRHQPSASLLLEDCFVKKHHLLCSNCLLSTITILTHGLICRFLVSVYKHMQVQVKIIPPNELRYMDTKYYSCRLIFIGPPFARVTASILRSIDFTSLSEMISLYLAI